MTIDRRGRPYFARTLAALSSPMKDATLLRTWILSAGLNVGSLVMAATVSSPSRTLPNTCGHIQPLGNASHALVMIVCVIRVNRLGAENISTVYVTSQPLSKSPLEDKVHRFLLPPESGERCRKLA